MLVSGTRLSEGPVPESMCGVIYCHEIKITLFHLCSSKSEPLMQTKCFIVCIYKFNDAKLVRDVAWF